MVQGLEWNVDAEASAVGGPRCIGGLGLWCPLVRPVVPSGLAISPNCSGEYCGKRAFSDHGLFFICAYFVVAHHTAGILNGAVDALSRNNFCRVITSPIFAHRSPSTITLRSCAGGCRSIAWTEPRQSGPVGSSLC